MGPYFLKELNSICYYFEYKEYLFTVFYLLQKISLPIDSDSNDSRLLYLADLILESAYYYLIYKKNWEDMGKPPLFNLIRHLYKIEII